MLPEIRSLQSLMVANCGLSDSGIALTEHITPKCSDHMLEKLECWIKRSGRLLKNKSNNEGR